MNNVFSDFRKNFMHFFDSTEKGFQNECIINMYCRIYAPDTPMIKYSEKFNEMYFLTEGKMRMQNKFGVLDFLHLPQHSFFGDY